MVFSSSGRVALHGRWNVLLMHLSDELVTSPEADVAVKAGQEVGVGCAMRLSLPGALDR